MKLTVIACLLSLLIGLAIGFKLFSKPPLPAEIKTVTNTKYKKIIEPGGLITETIDTQESSEVKSKSKYLLSVKGYKQLDSIQAQARLGDLPLFAGIDLSKKEQIEMRAVLTLEF